MGFLLLCFLGLLIISGGQYLDDHPHPTTEQIFVWGLSVLVVTVLAIVYKDHDE